MVELINKLEYSLKEAFDLDVSVTFNKGEIIIHGLSSNLDEVKAWIFIHGFLSGWKYRNKSLIKLYSPEVG